MIRWTQKSRRTAGALFGVAVAALAVLLSPPTSNAGATATGSISGTVFPGSAVQNATHDFTVNVTGSGMQSSQTVQSLLVTMGSDWSITGPGAGTSNGAGWTMQSKNQTTICWGGKPAMVNGVAMPVPVTASTNAPLGMATWTVQAYGDSSCSKDVKPTLASPTAAVFIAVAQVGNDCPSTANCSTAPVSDPNAQNTVQVASTGTSTGQSFVSAAVLSTPTDLNTLTCPKTTTYDPALGNTVQTLVSGGPRTHVMVTTMAQALVNQVADNGASHMDMCLRSEQPFTTKDGSAATAVGPFKLPGTGQSVIMYQGFLPRCGAVPTGSLPPAPCLLQVTKTTGGVVQFEAALAPGDPYARP